ncbi:hypothetical protein VTN31DRAFT_5612 [Thermomyces dupontii]|uniref:uncharacterized protein n=1 Tax=Talaromyces thermophilus TaxID=28565 RepID=UPI0037421B30
MPCFKGLAVSIHTPDGPLPEYSVQRQSRASRIACFIPVPPPKLSPETGKPEQSTFAISITLLEPHQIVPYSTPKPTPENPYPKPRYVGPMPDSLAPGEKYPNAVVPYQPKSGLPNETVAAYIYFDGRQKEEVATLLRKGEETWVNSRWVSVPESEGGGLAEREFLFREVGLERWLNGLDLEGKDVAATIERRRKKIEKRRMKKDAQRSNEMDQDNADRSERKEGVMRYGADADSPLGAVSDEDVMSDDSDSDDDPIPESAGQIKVALFRVQASGEVKRGEYSPQFDAHDDEDETEEGGVGVDHTTSFAQPKSLDPKSISTQTVTPIDSPDSPYAVFTFMYRGERQLQKMGILKPKSQKDTKRRSLQPDFSNLGPLKPGGTVGFLNYRESNASGRGKSKRGSADDMDSDEEEDQDRLVDKADEEATNDVTTELTPDDLRRQKVLEEGVRKIRLKRQHSSEDVTENTSKSDTPASASTPPATSSTPPSHGPASTSKTAEGASSAQEPAPSSEFIGSPMKKARASVSAADEDDLRRRLASGSVAASSALGEKLQPPTTSANTDATPAASTGAGAKGSHFGNSVSTQLTQPPSAEMEEGEL